MPNNNIVRKNLGTNSMIENDAVHLTAEKINCPSCSTESQFIFFGFVHWDKNSKMGVLYFFESLSIHVMMAIFPLLFIFLFADIALRIFEQIKIVEALLNARLLFEFYFKEYWFLPLALVGFGLFSMLWFLVSIQLANIPYGNTYFCKMRYISISNLREILGDTKNYLFDKGAGWRIGRSGSLFGSARALFISKEIESWHSNPGEETFHGDGEIQINGGYKYRNKPLIVSSFLQCPSCKSVYNLNEIIGNREGKVEMFYSSEN